MNLKKNICSKDYHVFKMKVELSVMKDIFFFTGYDLLVETGKQSNKELIMK